MLARARCISVLVLLVVALVVAGLVPAVAADEGLVAYWKLTGDARDHSGHGRHAQNHGVDLSKGGFDGRRSYLEAPHAPELDLGAGDFSIAARIYTGEGLDDVFGDILSKYDPAARRGLNLSLVCNTSGYNGQSDLRQLYLGTDNAGEGEWIDCGRPGGVTHCSDALTVFDGDLYVGTVDAPEQQDWAHVYRYRGGQQWEDCGRVGDRQTRGVFAMIVHDGQLYAGTAGPHGGPKSNTGDFGRVYRYRGGQRWEDAGQPGGFYRINSLASYKGQLYAAAINTGGSGGGVFVHEGGHAWKQIGDFGRPHTLGVHDGVLYAAYPQGEVFAYDGSAWTSLGNPLGSIEACNQLHSQGVYGGELYVGTWPLGKVALRRDGAWADVGRLGDATEVVGLTVYNGALYGGSIPRAEVFRYDGPSRWTPVGRLFDPPDYDAKKHVEDWTRASSLRVYEGKLFCTTATCYRAQIDAPNTNEIRGKVYSYQSGAGVSHDRDLGPGWHDIAAIRDGDSMKLYVDGAVVASATGAAAVDISNEAPLRIGLGSQSHFKGRIQHVRLYNRALGDAEVESLRTADGG